MGLEGEKLGGVSSVLELVAFAFENLGGGMGVVVKSSSSSSLSEPWPTSGITEPRVELRREGDDGSSLVLLGTRLVDGDV